MARSRNIKPGFFMNDLLAEVDPLGRLLFAGLWTIADREGRLEDRPRRIKAEILPYDNCDVDQLLDDLEKLEFVLRYEVAGERYIQIINFSKHQNPHKNETASEIPAPEEHDAKTVQVSCKSDTNKPEQKNDNTGKPNNHGHPKEHHTSTVQVPEGHGTSTVQAPGKHSTNRADSLNLIPDSLNTDSLKPNSGTSIGGGGDPIVNILRDNIRLDIRKDEVEKISAWLDDGIELEVIEWAAKEARMSGNRNINYLSGILRNLHAEGVLTMDGVQAREERFNRRKNKESPSDDDAIGTAREKPFDFEEYKRRQLEFVEKQKKLAAEKRERASP